MKKLIFTLTVLFTAAFTLIPLTGCQDAIFYTIRKEVELEDATLQGDIQSIVRYTDPTDSTEYLYIANGGIHYKETDVSKYGAWSEDSTEPDGHITQIAADGTYLYAVVVTYEEDTSEGENVLDSRKLYYSEGVDAGATTAWTEIDTSGYDDMDNSGKTVKLFCTNSPNNSNRSAYINIGGTTYSLDGSTALAGAGAVTVDGTDSDALSAVYFNSTVLFFDTTASCTNETADTAPTYVYYADDDDDNLYYSTDGSSYTDTGSYDISDIISLAVTSDSILMGTKFGIEKTSNSSGVPGSSTGDFDTNADSTLSSLYRVQALLAVDPSAAETDGDLYAALDFTGSSSSSSAQFDDIGLWAYYPSRGNWNRE
jgi:hypothetical protein